ncbi:MAG: TetR/AcrR family transcriptional regulator [Candidatus Methylomirabilota bacterium]
MRYQERFEAVLKSAASVFADRGYDRASIRDVAKAAGMSVPGLYYYCKSKDELLFGVCYHSFEVLLRNLHRVLKDVSNPVQQLQLFILNHFEYFLNHVDAMKVVSHEAGMLTGELGLRVAEIKRKYYVRCQQIIQAILDEADSDSPRLRTTTLALFGMINWVYTWYRPGRDYDAKQLADSMTDLFLLGVRPYARSGEGQEVNDGAQGGAGEGETSLGRGAART